MKIEHLTISRIGKDHMVSEDASRVGESDDQFVAAVVDGHGDPQYTPRICKFVAGIAEMLKEGRLDKSIRKNFPTLFAAIDVVLEGRFGKVDTFGAVALCAAIDKLKGVVTFAYVGDCRAYQFDRLNPYANVLLTDDHNADNPKEAERIKPLCIPGGVAVIPWGKERSDGGKPLKLFVTKGRDSKVMDPTRGFGDYQFRPVYSQVPEVRQLTLDPNARTLFAICSDGGVPLVRGVFQHLRLNNIDLSRDDLLNIIQLMADLFFAKQPDDDATAVFILVRPDSPTT